MSEELSFGGGELVDEVGPLNWTVLRSMKVMICLPQQRDVEGYINPPGPIHTKDGLSPEFYDLYIKGIDGKKILTAQTDGPIWVNPEVTTEEMQLALIELTKLATGRYGPYATGPASQTHASIQSTPATGPDSDPR